MAGEIIFADKSVSYEDFRNDIQLMIVEAMRKLMPPAETTLSKRQAQIQYGRRTVDRWIRDGKLLPSKVTPSRIYFKKDDLDFLQGIVQDYL